MSHRRHVHVLLLPFGLVACASEVTVPPTRTAHLAIEEVEKPVAPLFVEGSKIPEATLRDAAEEKVGVAELGPAVVVKSWTWHPRGPEPPYVVWITCRGEGAERVCGLAAAVPAPDGAGNLKATAFTHLGFSRANVDCGGEWCRVEGTDDRGTWTQALEILQDGTLKFTRRTYPRFSHE